MWWLHPRFAGWTIGSELERLLGRRTTEVEILEEALDLAWERPCCRDRSFRRIPVKRIAGPSR